MGEGRHKEKPTLSPPPRITGPRGADPGAGPGDDGSRTTRRLLRGVLFAILVVGLLGVFLVLPRWQDRRQDHVMTTDTILKVETPTPRPHGPTTAPEIATPQTPSPMPTPTRIPTIVAG